MAWILTNHYEDQKVEYDKLKLVCRFINPEAAEKVFKEDSDIQNEEETVLETDQFLAEINEHTGKNFDSKTLEDQIKIAIEGDNSLDVIERVQ